MRSVHIIALRNVQEGENTTPEQNQSNLKQERNMSNRRFPQWDTNPSAEPSAMLVTNNSLESTSQAIDNPAKPNLPQPARERQLTKENAQLKRQLAALQQDIDAVHDALEATHDKLECTTKDLDAMRENYDTIQEEQSALQDDCNKARAEYNDVRLDLEASRADNSKLNQNLDDLKNKLRQLQQNTSIESSTTAEVQKLQAEVRRQADEAWRDKLDRENSRLELDRVHAHEKRAMEEDFRLRLKVCRQEALDAQKMQKESHETVSADLTRTSYQQLEDDLRKERVSSRAALAIERQRYEDARTNIKTLEEDRRKERETFETSLAEQTQKHEDTLRQVLNLQTELLSARREAMAAAMNQTAKKSSTITTVQNPSIGSAMQIDSSENATKLIEELQASHAAEVEELRRLMAFFKSNSERLSRESRELRSTNRTLMESVESKDRELEDQVSHIHAIETQLEEYQAHKPMPGGWE